MAEKTAIRTNGDGLVIYPYGFKAHLEGMLRRSAPFLEALYGVGLKKPGIVYSPYGAGSFAASYCPNNNIIIVTPTLLKGYLGADGYRREYVDIAIAHELAHGYLKRFFWPVSKPVPGGDYGGWLKELGRPCGGDGAQLAAHKGLSSKAALFYGMEEALTSLAASFVITRMNRGEASDAEVFLHALHIEDRRLVCLKRDIWKAEALELRLAHGDFDAKKQNEKVDTVDISIHILKNYPKSTVLLAEIFLAIPGAPIDEMVKTVMHNAWDEMYFPKKQNETNAFAFYERQVNAVMLLRAARAGYEELGPGAPRGEKIAYALDEIQRLESASTALKAKLATLPGSVPLLRT